jgi:hypothetical protein
MGDQAQITAAGIGSALSWRDIEDQERRAEGQPSADTQPEIIGEIPGEVPSIVPDGLEEDYFAAERRANWRTDGWPRRDDATPVRGLVVAILLAFVAVATLLGVAFAV